MTLIQSLSRIDDFLSQNVPDQLSLWGHGLNDEQINDLVKDIPFFFPEEVRELYRWHNGTEYHWICSHAYPLRSLEEVIELYKYFSDFPEIWESQLFVFGLGKDNFLVDIKKTDSPVWYNFAESPATEIFWSSITKMMQTIANACETGVYSLLDNGYFASDNKKFLEAMWRNDPDTMNSLVEHLRTVKKERLDCIPDGYDNIQRLVWGDNSKLFDKIRSASLEDPMRVEMLQEFTSIFLEECEQIIGKAI
jgi:hypothetical protein